jgi:hypothetical protein
MSLPPIFLALLAYPAQALAGPASGLRTLNLNGCNAIRAVDLAGEWGDERLA